MDDGTRTPRGRFRYGRQLRMLLGAVFVAGLVFSLNACADRMVTSRSDKQIDAFFEHAEADKEHVWLEEAAPGFVATLPSDGALRLAERALAHPDAAVRAYGLQLLYQLGLDARGDLAAAELLVRGDDLTGIGWGWLHSGDPTLLERRLRGIREAVASRIETMRPAERKAAEEFLCEGREACIGKNGPETSGP